MTDEEFLINLGARIKHLRVQKDMTLQELADRCQFQKANLSRIESGKTNISILTLKKIADCLNKKIGSFFPNTGNH